MGWLINAIIDVFFKLYELIADVYNGIVRTLQGWLQALLDTLYSVIAAIGKIISDVVSFVVNVVTDFCLYLYDMLLGEEGFVWYILDYGIGLANNLIESFPSIGEVISRYKEHTEPVLALIGRLDQFVPLTELYYLIVTYIGIVVLLIILRTVLKFVPGLGG